jgi:hypothetical protein
MVDPRIMCRKHLLGEHVEHHMFVGAINKGKNIAGFLLKNLLEPLSLLYRHAALVEEMERRGYKHKSPLPLPIFAKDDQRLLFQIDKDSAQAELIRRCPECRNRYIELLKQEQSLDSSFFYDEEQVGKRESK